ncbi:hypothetical protein C7H19_06935 [Aphanothece hegewaldii CCALA 016]|uniref:Bestrophin n=1 Tax=Aphanothece hegewaldii CCALA 016 TaxID=2107694 RepID=A0A2T1M0L0_9CHRO|nr:bestrophin family ion channel [Aphanothece hegewaldii]PSF38200.1 hypothetical protein C7H19_06935 [Aphanothece hegewaldii CCALA 016]
MSNFKKISQHHQEQKTWFKTTFRLKGSVIPSIFFRVMFCSFLALILAYAYAIGYKSVALPIDGTISSLVLGLLLVFRTNTAYERFWEGRKLWGELNNKIRNLTRAIWVFVVEESPEDRNRKISILYLLVAFAVATKLHLRDETNYSELKDLMTDKKYEKLKHMNHIPLEIAFLVGDYLQEQYQRNCLNSYQLTAMSKILDQMVDTLGGCERILRTPLPLAYSIHLKQLLFLYCLSLPFELVDRLQWSTPIVVGILSFTVFGIEEIGLEIENPFGKDPNDLPLDQICENIKINLEDLISFAPSVRNWSNNKSLVQQDAESEQPLLEY